MIEYQTCKACCVDKPLSDFHHKNGRARNCKVCARAAKAKRARKPPPRPPLSSRKKLENLMIVQRALITVLAKKEMVTEHTSHMLFKLLR